MFTQTIRRQFLQYFKERGHSIVPSSPVIPHDDPSLLFINAGMNQFKDVFLGKTTRDYKRAATAQKCIRVGGKHNDLENVGHTSRYLTFFEMLGNFSFGDYFKPEAIRFAWEVSTEVFGFAPDRIWPTVFREDDEAFEIWRQYVPADRITRFDEKDNFWMMGETGPCGPCSELLYDRGKEFGSGSKPSEDPSGERFLEFWNLVFMQSDRRASGEIVSLPSPSIDTGAGLERVVNLKTGTRTVFETDVLRELIAGTEAVTGISYRIDDERAAAFHVIADHLRCLAFAIADGVQPSNTDRGYVLRKVLRRAVRYGRRLGADRPFLADLLPGLISTMGGDYPELTKSRERIREILTVEEEAFLRTLRRGGNILNQVIEKAKHSGTIEGDEAFKLKDTYGLPLDEIRLIAKDSDLGIDEVRFNRLEEEARLRSRNIQKNTGQTTEINLFSRIAEERGESEFIGYTHLQGEATVVGVVVNGEPVDSIESGTEAVVLLNRTPFYAETGGQVGDTGFLTGPGVSFKVIDCQTPYKGIIAHRGVLLEGVLKTGDSLFAEVDKERRQKTANNHTATHLLHWALHQVLGEHIKQAGSVVDPGRLRFDFSHHKALSPEDVRRIEDLVNDKIRENRPVSRYELKYEEAQKRDDIKQFFGEKYGTVVRVVDIDYSKELCGGTHTDAVGTIGLFRIVKESSIAAGIRRIEAVTGKEAEEYVREQENLLSGIAESLKVPVNQVRERIEKLSEENRALVKEAKIGRTEKLKALVASLADRSVQEGELRSIVAEVSVSSEELVECLDLAFEQADSGVVLLAIKLPSGCRLAVKIGDKWIKRGFSAGDLIKLLMPIVDGSGGGKPGMAQGSGKSSERLEEALAKAREYLLEKATQ